MNETILAKAELLRAVVDANKLIELRIKKENAKSEFLKEHYSKAYQNAVKKFKEEEMRWELQADIYGD